MPGLTVSRREGEKIVCHVGEGRTITFTLQEIYGRKARINIEAPGSVKVLREELRPACDCPVCIRARLRVRALAFLRDNSDPDTIAVREFLLRWLEELEAITPASGPTEETIARANGNGVRLDFACQGLRS